MLHEHKRTKPRHERRYTDECRSKNTDGGNHKRETFVGWTTNTHNTHARKETRREGEGAQAKTGKDTQKTERVRTYAAALSLILTLETTLRPLGGFALFVVGEKVHSCISFSVRALRASRARAWRRFNQSASRS